MALTELGIQLQTPREQSLCFHEVVAGEIEKVRHTEVVAIPGAYVLGRYAQDPLAFTGA